LSETTAADTPPTIQGQSWKYLLRTQQDSLGCFATSRLRGQRTSHPTKSFTAPLNPRHPTVGALIHTDSFPGQTHDRTTGPRIRPKTDRESHAPRDAPEPDSP
jgi:hypothetical protein